MNIEEIISRNPLLKFSLYTDLQAKTVIKLGCSIKNSFDEMMVKKGTVDLVNGDPYGDIWLWILGVYEVTRTMADPKWSESWEKEKLQEIVNFKKYIADIRVPFAKLEHRNSKSINGECSIYGFDFETRSYLFEIKDTVYNIREIINKFENLIHSIQEKHVIKDLRENQ